MGNRITRDENISRFNDVYGIGRYNYSLLTEIVNSREKIPIICENKDEFGNIHGTFWQTPDSHRHGHGCSKCYGNNKLNKEEFIRRALNIEKHKIQGYTYDNFVYVNSDTKGQIDCPIHGAFFKSPYKHVNVAQGCQECMKKELNMMFATKNDDFIQKALNIKEHKNKNYEYDWFIYVNNKTKGKIWCPKKGHGFFMQKPDHHLAGIGCPNCQESKGELIILEFLKNNTIHFNRQKTFKECVNPHTSKKLKFDFYLPYYNMCIEFNGKQHYEPIEYFGGTDSFKSLQYRDKIKQEFCKNNHINFMKIKYDENILIKLPRVFMQYDEKHSNKKFF